MLLTVLIFTATYLILGLLREPLKIDFVPMVVFMITTLIISSGTKALLEKRILNFYETNRDKEDEKELVEALPVFDFLLCIFYAITIGGLMYNVIKYIEFDTNLIDKMVIPLCIMLVISILMFVICYNKMKKDVIHTALLVLYQEAFVFKKVIAIVMIIIGLVSMAGLALLGIFLALGGLFGSRGD